MSAMREQRGLGTHESVCKGTNMSQSVATLSIRTRRGLKRAAMMCESGRTSRTLKERKHLKIGSRLNFAFSFLFFVSLLRLCTQS